MSRRDQTPSQTVGPFFHMRLGGAQENRLCAPAVAGALRLEGRVLDGEGQPVGDALLEVWQADGDGRFCHPLDRWPPEPGRFTGFGRATTNAKTGAYAFETRKPGRVRDAAGAWQAPHLSVVVFARGLLGHLYTRVYFDDEVRPNAEDPVLSSVPPERRRTLVASRVTAGSPGDVPDVYRHDLVLQGEGETVFFDV
ncbi:MAG: protocatechuate 3,4-dioxygenase subunit alpha [Myxococcales bacterium]|nr:protocatechuate 3,4-dioxygenase subunit alpha [Myxococcales bacterium]